MAATTVTFSTVASQADVEFVDDRSKPGWDELLASDLRAEDEGKKDQSVKKRGQKERSSTTF